MLVLKGILGKLRAWEIDRKGIIPRSTLLDSAKGLLRRGRDLALYSTLLRSLWAPRLLRSGGVLVEVFFFENCRVTTLLCISA